MYTRDKHMAIQKTAVSKWEVAIRDLDWRRYLQDVMVLILMQPRQWVWYRQNKQTREGFDGIAARHQVGGD